MGVPLKAISTLLACVAAVGLGSGASDAAASMPSRATAADVGSCRPGVWRSVGGDHVLVHWRVDSLHASRDHERAVALSAVLNGRIWSKLKGLMRAPLSDASEPCNGGDGRLDVWLTPQKRGVYGHTITYMGDEKWRELRPCPAVPVYIELNPQTATREVAAHEFMHAVEFGYRLANTCYTYGWLGEATSTWAEEYVYHRDDDEHQFYRGLAWPWISLDIPAFYDRDQWTFFYYLTQTLPGGAALIPKIFQMAGSLSAEQAVDAAIPGGFQRRMPQYAVYAWNQPPIGPSFEIHVSFRQWDRLAVVPRASRYAPLRTVPVRISPLSLKLNLDSSPLYELSRRYFHFSFPDPHVRYVVLQNGWAGHPGASLQAMIKIGGRWRLEDWSAKPTVKLCRDKPGENVQDLILVLANSSIDAELTPSGKPTLEGTAPCPNTYSGTFSGSYNYPGGGTLSWTGQVRFATPGMAYTGSRVNVTSGSVAWTVSGTDASGCTFSGSGSFSLTGNDGGIYVYPDGSYYVTVAAAPYQDPPASWQQPVTRSCPGYPAQQELESWYDYLESGTSRQPSGSTLSGSYSQAANWSWNLTAGE